MIAKGKEIFGNRFKPIINYMSREKYVELLNSMDVVSMYHNRSQAIGNIFTALTLGKPVFLKKKSSSTEFFSNLGLHIYDSDNIKNSNLEKIIEESINNRKKIWKF